LPGFITQVAPCTIAEEEVHDAIEQSRCFCSTLCMAGKSIEKQDRAEANYPTTTASFDRVKVRTEKRASIVRTNTQEGKPPVQQTAVQLATVPASTNDECYIPEIEESTEEEEASPWAEDGESVLVTTNNSSSIPASPKLLGPKLKKYEGMKCLVLDLDETLVHSSFKPVEDAHYLIPVEIDRIIYKVYVRKRPFVDMFLTECAKHYEVVVFTASLSKYANPLLDMLDRNRVVAHRLFRESCVYHRSAYVKDLTRLGRPMKDIIIVDNSSLSYSFQPTNAIPITSWFQDRRDVELRDLLPVLQTTLKEIDDVRSLLDASKPFQWICNQAAKGPKALTIEL
jgi:RNA polymerase II subunit A small phosphatase-like protein